MKQTSFTSLLILAVAVCPVFAGPLKEAKISQIINDVKVVEPRRGARPAALQELIKDDLGVATGIQSRAELLFQDNTLTRLGAETFFSFEPGTRNLKLERGSMLLQVPKGLGGAHIRAASVSASITGTTIMVEHLSGQRVKIVVLEGGLRVGVDRRPAASLMLQAGKMVIVAPDAKELPKPVDVDLRKLVRTSALIDPVLFNGKTRGSAAALPSLGLIEKEIAQQEAKPNDATPTAANTDAPATGADGPQIAGENRAPLDPTHLATGIGKTETPLPKTVITPDLNEPAPTVPNPAPAADTSTPVGTEPATGTGTSSTITTATQMIATRGIANAGGLYQSAAARGPASAYLFDTPSAFDAAHRFDSRFSMMSGGTAPGTGVAVYRFAGFGLQGPPAFSVAGSSVNIVANGTIAVGSSVKVSDSTPGRASSQGGSIRLDSRKTTGTAIAINNSGQLLTLLSPAAPGPGGTIQFTSAGGDIRVPGGKIQADRGSVDIRNNGPARLIQFNNATLSGDVVKVGALGANGRLIIGGGILSADTSLKLYGGSNSNGQVRFTDNVTLGGNGAKSNAGKTVTGGGGSAENGHTDNPNYTGSGGNSSTSGASRGKGAAKQGFASRPAF